MQNLVSTLFNNLKKNNSIGNVVKDDQWDVFNEDYYKIIQSKENWETFRRNGISNMLETGLPSQDRFTLINTKSLYPVEYNNDEVEDIITRYNELVEYAGLDFVNKYLEQKVGSPRSFIHNDNHLNFDDLYHVYALWQITRLVNPPKQIVEIGGGYGNLASKLLKYYHTQNIHPKYVIIDLPEVLMVQHYYLHNSNPNLKIVNISDTDHVNLPEYDVLLVPANYYHNLSFDIDLVINMRSFGEMPKLVLTDYFNWIQKNIVSYGIIYFVNRYLFTKSVDKMKLRDYPMDDNWKIVLSQPQWLQSHLHEFLLQRHQNPDYKFKNILQSMPLRNPPAGPIMKMQSQQEWMICQNIPL